MDKAEKRQHRSCSGIDRSAIEPPVDNRQQRQHHRRRMPQPSLFSEQFPVETRAIGVSLGFSTAVSIFGGLAPLVATWLIAVTGDSLSPSYYLIFTALLSVFALMAIQWRSRRVAGTLAHSSALAAP